MMQGNPLFQSAELKIQRANEHINNLNSFIAHVLDSGYYGVFCDKDPETGIYIFKAGSRNGVPAQIPLLIGDVIHNLRSALDHIITEVVGGEKTSIYFPFHRDAESFMSTKNRRIIEARSDINTGCPGLWEFIVKELKPYESGNYALWAITKLDAIDKHKFIIPIVTVAQVIIMNLYDKEHGITMRENIIQVHGGRAIGLLSSRHEFDFEGNVECTLQVLFPPGGFFENEPIIPTLFNLCQLVTEVLQAIRLFISDNGIVIGGRDDAA